VSESWLTRYLDLARLPAELTRAFARPEELSIRNAIALKGFLKPEERRVRAFAEAERLASERRAGGADRKPLDVIKALALAIAPPKKSGPPKRSGFGETITSALGKPVVRLEGADRKGVRLVLLNKGGASREDAEVAIRAILDQHWS
jgi:ParB family chromosome partitioning protein